MPSPHHVTSDKGGRRRRTGLGLGIVLLPLILAGCTGERQRDPLGAQYYPDPAYGGRRTAFQTKPEGYAPPRIAPATQVWPPGPF